MTDGRADGMQRNAILLYWRSSAGTLTEEDEVTGHVHGDVV